MKWSMIIFAAVSVSGLTSGANAGSTLVGGPAMDAPAFGGFGYFLPEVGVVPGFRVNDAGVAIGWVRAKDASGLGAGDRATAWNAGSGAANVLAAPSSLGGNDYQAYAINRAGVIVGHGVSFNQAAGVSRGIRAYRWESANASPVELQPLNTDFNGGAIAEAYTLNDAGTVVGAAHWYGADGRDYGTRVVRWSAGSMTAVQLNGLAPNSQPHQSAAYAVSASGTVVGFASLDDQRYYAARWVNGSTTPQQLASLGQGDPETVSMALDVNVAGTAIGYSTRYASNHGERSLGPRAARWNAGGTQVVELGHLGTSADGFTVSQANAINDAGTVIGYASKYNAGIYAGTRPTLWNANATAVVALGMLGADAGGNAEGTADDINASGVAVGRVQKFNGTTLVGDRAVLWLTVAPQTAVDLNTLLPVNSGWTLNAARGISDTGFVSGLGSFDPAGAAPAYDRQFTLLVPQAGTYGKGDANFDTAVGFDDLLIVAQHYGQPNNTHSPYVGDFDLNGSTDFADLLVIAQNYGAGSLVEGSRNGTFMQDWALARSITPEPATLSALAGLTAVLRRRR